jgi:hypothetical protein
MRATNLMGHTQLFPQTWVLLDVQAADVLRLFTAAHLLQMQSEVLNLLTAAWFGPSGESFHSTHLPHSIIGCVSARFSS